MGASVACRTRDRWKHQAKPDPDPVRVPGAYVSRSLCEIKRPTSRDCSGDVEALCALRRQRSLCPGCEHEASERFGCFPRDPIRLLGDNRRWLLAGAARLLAVGLSRGAVSSGGSGSWLEPGGCWDHWYGLFVNGVHDLGVVDPAQIRRGDRKVGVPQLALDDDDRNTFA